MKRSATVGVIGVLLLGTVFSCGGDTRDEDFSRLQIALTSNERILTYEGQIGGAGADWTAGAGTNASASSTSFEGRQALALSGSQNPSAISAQLSTIGPMASKATVEIALPSSLQGQGWFGQVALLFNAPSRGLFNQYAGPTTLSGPLGQFRHYETSLPSNVVTALSGTTFTDLQITVQLNVPSTSGVFLIDKLSLGQSSGSGGSGGVGGPDAGADARGASGGSSGTAGSTGNAGGGLGVGGASGASGATGSSGSGGLPAGTSVEFFLKLPAGVSQDSVALASHGPGALQIDDRVRVVGESEGFSSIASVGGSAQSRVGVEAEVQNVWSVPSLQLANRAHVHGFARSSGAVSKAVDAIVDGGISEQADLGPIQTLRWTVTFPTQTQGAINLEPDQSRSIAPGAYLGANVKSRGRLSLTSPGTYTFDDSVVVEPDSVLEINNAAGSVLIYVKNGFTFRGSIAKSSQNANVLFGIAGGGAIPIERSFDGILVAPQATVSLATTSTGHRLSVFAGGVVAHQSTTIHHQPFDPRQFCTLQTSCTSFCPCAPECIADSDCAPGLVCGKDNGAHFGEARTVDRCWLPGCETDPRLFGCGFEGAPCGGNCETVRPCGPNRECPTGEVCGFENGPRFESQFSDVCWPQECESSAVANLCGTTTSACGRCVCQPNCANKHCGDNPDDGCGGECTGYCADGEAGCISDSQCQRGSVCGIGKGPRFGLPAGTNTCWRRACSDVDVTRVDCGPGRPCGSCEPCVPDCSGLSCGPDPHCGVECGPCGPQESCNGGQCSPLVLPREIRIPDGSGSFRILPPLDPFPTEPVGALEGTFNVSDRGTATYSVPITVPPGRAGFQPRLGLRYTSSKANGLLGVGWSIEGLSTISRCPRTMAQDGWPAPIRLDDGDRFCLDGQRLVAIRGVYGADGTEYRTEVDSFARVRSFGRSGAGPSHFKVWTKSGEILTYGANENSSIFGDLATRTKRAWALDRTEDRAGNLIGVRYKKFDIDDESACNQPDLPKCGTTEIAPDMVAYGSFQASVTTVPDRYIRFVYTNGRVDGMAGFATGGAPIERTRLLARVETYTQGQRVRAYKLTYGIGPSATNRITELRECAHGEQNEVCKPPTRFTYNDEQGYEPAVSTGLFPFGPVSPGKPIFDNRLVIVLDANGDGRDDFLRPANTTELSSKPVWLLFLSKETAPFFEEVRTGIPVVSEPRAGAEPPGCFNRTSVIDFNRDGRDDLFDICIRPSGVYRVFLSTAQGFVAVPSGVTSGKPTRESATAFLFDVDGDGLKDFVEETGVVRRGTDLEGECTGIMRYFPQKLDGGFNNSPRGLAKFGRCAAPPLLLDSDGDGNPNLMRHDRVRGWGSLVTLSEASETWVTNQIKNLPSHGAEEGLIKVIDLNGDGLLDLYSFVKGEDQPRYFLNTSVGFTPIRRDGNIMLSNSFRSSQVVDFDGDARQDLIRNADPPFNQANWVLHRGTRDGLSEVRFSRDASGHETVTNLIAPPSPIPPPSVPICDPDLSSPDGHCILKSGSERSHVSWQADFNADDNPDLFLIRANGEMVVFPRRGARANLLTRVVDGLGKRIDVEYERISQFSPTYTPGSNCSGFSQCVRKVGPLVSAHRESQETKDSAGALSVEPLRLFRYRYEDAQEGLRGRGWLGFARRIIQEHDGSGAQILTTTIDYDNRSTSGNENLFVLAGRVKQSVSLTPIAHPEQSSIASIASARRVTVTNEWEVKTSADGRPFPFLEQRLSVISEDPGNAAPLPLQARFEIFTGDGYGNVTGTDAGNFKGNFTTLLDRTQIQRVFEPTSAEIADWLITLPKSEVVSDVLLNGTPDRGLRTTRFGYYPNGQLQTVTREPNDAAFTLTTTLERNNPFNNVDAITLRDAQGNERRTTIKYDSRGLLPELITKFPAPSDAQPTEVRFGDAHGELLAVTDPNGIAEQSSYDGFGRLRFNVAPDTTRTVSYQSAVRHQEGPLTVAASFRVATAIAGGPSVEEEFDGFGRPVGSRVTGFLDSVVQHELSYDTAGRLARAARPHLPGDVSQGIIQYDYDVRQRLVRETFPDSTTTRYAYATAVTLRPELAQTALRDPSAMEISATTNPRGFTETIASDQRGNPVIHIDPKGDTTDYRYEGFNHLDRIIDDAGNETTMRPDRYGRVELYQDPDTGAQRYTYNAFGEVRTHTDGNNAVSEFFYDLLGRLRRLENADGTTEWIYDRPGPNTIGRLVQTIGPPGDNAPLGHQTIISYEPPGPSRNRGLPASVSNIIDDEEFVTRFDFDDFGRLEFLHYPNARDPANPTAPGVPFVLHHQYDAAGNLIKVCQTNCAGIGASPFWQLTAHDQGYRIGEEQSGSEGLGNAIKTLRSYERLTGRLSTLETRRRADVLRSLGYRYDANGNVELIRNLMRTDADRSFVYDELDRLTHTLRQLSGLPGGIFMPEFDYEYNSVGNMTSQTGVGAYTYRTDHVQPHAVQSAGDRSFVYDSNGNQLRRSGTGIPGGQQVIEYTMFDMPKSIGSPGMPAVQLEYDAMQSRVVKRGGAGSTVYVGDAYERRPGSAGGASVPEHNYLVYAAGRQVAQVSRTVQSNGGTSEAVRLLHGNHLGSIELMTDATGAVLHEQEFKPYGGVNGTPGGSTGVLAGFTGHQHDSDLGLINMKGRMYDPLMARFITADPLRPELGTSQSLNPYSYVFNNPLNLTDPSGFEADVDKNGTIHFSEERITAFPRFEILEDPDDAKRRAKAGFQPGFAEVEKATRSAVNPQAGSDAQATSRAREAAVADRLLPPPPIAEPPQDAVPLILLGDWSPAQINQLERSIDRAAYAAQPDPQRDVQHAAVNELRQGDASVRERVYQLQFHNDFVLRPTAELMGIWASMGIPGGSAARGSEAILFGQSSVARAFTTAEAGSTFELAGRSIAEVAAGLRSGAIAPSQIPIRVVQINGRFVAVNNRSLAAFARAGMQPTNIIDLSSNRAVVQQVLGRLAEMGGAPSETILIRGMGPNASAVF